MPKMINLESAGLRCSARLASQPRMKYNSSLTLVRLCKIELLIVTSLSQPMAVFSYGQATIDAGVHQYNVINANVDGSLNEIHHIALGEGKTNIENYTFREC